MPRLIAIAALLTLTARLAAEDTKPAAKEPVRTEKPGVIRDEVPGSINHGKGMNWNRIIGKVKVLDASNIEFADGTRIELDITVPAPGQMAMNDDGLYPCGREAAEFLSKFIGDKTVMCFKNDRDGPSMGYVGNDNLERVMIVNGWGLADHSSLHADEIIARENKRGLWQGKFIHPDTWRAGVRLPGEMPPPKLKSNAEAERLIWSFGTDEDALPQILARVTTETPDLKTVRFHRGGAITDDGLAQLGKLKQLEVLDLSGCWSLSAQGLSGLKAFPHLRELSLPHNISDKGLEVLESLPELEYLLIDPWRGDPVTDAGLVHLKKLGRIRHLILNQPAVTDAGLPHLAGLTSLKILQFGDLPFTDAGLEHLAKLQNLEFLDISRTEITDAGLAKLSGLKQLRVLLLPERVTKGAREKLQRSLPDLKFTGDPPK
jgi:endonuclease YncB( thermonuclease family)